MRMVRPSRRKGIEEVYGSKMDTMQPVKSVVVTHAAGMTKTATMRAERAGAGGGGGGGGGAPGGGTITNRQMESRTQRSFVTDNDYYITTNVPMTATNLRNGTASQLLPGHPQPSPYNAMSSRRNNLTIKASARQPQMTKVPHFNLPEVKVNNSSGYNAMAKPKDSHRHGKANTQRSAYAMNDCGDFSDKELMVPHNRRQHSYVHQMQTQTMAMPHPPQHQLHQQQMIHHSHSKNQQQQHQHQQHQQQHQNPHPHPHQKHSRGRGQQIPSSKVHVSTADDDDEKDDDPEEFFELIRQTVQTAVGNTISDSLVKNFRDLGHKIDRFSGELKQTNDHLEKLQEQVTSKVIYYGEENSRHFRYLCMKSEYDKMFYQHQSMMGTNPTPEMINASKANLTAAASQATTVGCKPSQNLKHSGVKVSKNQSKMANKSDTLKTQTSAAYRSLTKAQPAAEPRKSSSDQSLTVKSSEMGMREVLGQIQRFCNQIQMNEMAGQAATGGAMPSLGDIMVPKKLSNAGLCDPGDLLPARNIAGCQGDKKDEDTEVDTPMDSMDEYAGMDEFQFSSEVSSCSDDDLCGLKYPPGDVTTRGPPIAIRNAANKGAGDGQ